MNKTIFFQINIDKYIILVWQHISMAVQYNKLNIHIYLAVIKWSIMPHVTL